MNRWDVVQERSINILSNFGPRGPFAKRSCAKEDPVLWWGGGGSKFVDLPPIFIQ